jgi:pyruvate/2-oxoglutarate dehydrogenase complex dihydrolipoamide acyltransferase (E2) component
MLVANEYNKAVNIVINKELPKQVKIKFIHYDVKAKKKEEKKFPFGLFALAKESIAKVGFFHIESSKS